MMLACPYQPLSLTQTFPPSLSLSNTVRCVPKISMTLYLTHSRRSDKFIAQIEGLWLLFSLSLSLSLSVSLSLLSISSPHSFSQILRFGPPMKEAFIKRTQYTTLGKVKPYVWGAARAEWICLCLPFCCPGF